MQPAQQRAVAEGLRRGTPEAWHALYDAYAESVWRGVARLVGDREAVADIVQETMLAAARSARQFDDGRGTLWGWLWGIAVHQVAQHYRRRARQPAGSVSAGAGPDEPLGRDPEPPVELLAAERVELVRDVLRRLSPEYSSLLIAKYVERRSLQELAELHGSTAAAIGSKLARARQAFARAWSDDEEHR